ncbi:MAG: bifunctional nuclease family protein [Acidobacteria bacterium]|nr:MAG: bifunctional nuclease family protein [Acidobacteriota bacterium]
MEVELRVLGLMADPITKGILLVLRQRGSDRKLPMWVGAFEADAIAKELEHIANPRPMTHDLIHAILDQLGARIAKVVITRVEGNVFYADLHLETPSGPRVVDCRPSDAIALALRKGVPIYARAEVLDRAERLDLAASQRDNEQIRAWLESLGAPRLGEYEQ